MEKEKQESVPSYFNGTPEEYDEYLEYDEEMSKAELWLYENIDTDLWENTMYGLVLHTDDAPDYVKKYVEEYNKQQEEFAEAARIRNMLSSKK